MQFLSSVFAAAAILIWGLAFYHWYLDTYTIGEIFIIVMVGVLVYWPAVYFGKKIKAKQKKKLTAKKEVEEKPNEVVEVGLEDEPKAEKETTAADNKAKGVSKTGLFGAAVGMYAASKANAVNKAPMVVVTHNREDCRGEVLGVRHIRGKKYRVFAALHWNNGNLQEIQFDVEPHSSGYSSGGVVFEARF